MLNSYLRIFIELCIGGIISGLLVSIWDGFLTKIQKKGKSKANTKSNTEIFSF